MAKSPMLVDRWGRPIDRSVLKTEIAAPTLGGVRSPLSGYPGDGLDPVRLASILREADAGDPIRYLELAEAIEERDLHYLAVLGTRRRGVSQIEITVEAASDAAEDVARAQLVREWLKRDELADEIFHILDCIGKGYSFTEIMWDTSEGQWSPARLEWRDPRWFRFEMQDLATPLQLDDYGQRIPLAPFKFIFAQISAKSGLALRSGLARVASWAWMFKAFTQRDWAIFTQTYGQPLRLGKWAPNASEDDKNTLFRAVSNIAGDCAAIIPESMSIEFVETKSPGTNSELYERRSDWLDQQVSKAVLGQTTTTDAISGGHSVSKEHRMVQKDISRSDGKALAAILNRDLIRPWMDLEFGPQKAYPRLKIEEAEVEDIQMLSTAVAALVPVGLKISQSEMRDRLGFADPAPGEEVLGVPAAPPVGPVLAPGALPSAPPGQASPIKRFSGEFKRGQGAAGMQTAPQAEGLSAANSGAATHADEIAARIEADAQPAVGRMLAQIEAMMTAAGSIEEFRAMLAAAFPKVDSTAFAQALAQGLVAAQAAGRAAVEEEAGG